MMLYASANRDEATVPDAGASSRSTGRCSKRCVTCRSAGASTTASERTWPASPAVALEELIRRLPALHLDEPTTRVPSPFLWGRKSLPVEWDVTGS